MTKQEKIKNTKNQNIVWIFFFPIAKFHPIAFPKEQKDLQMKMVNSLKHPEKKTDSTEECQLHTFPTSF